MIWQALGRNQMHAKLSPGVSASVYPVGKRGQYAWSVYRWHLGQRGDIDGIAGGRADTMASGMQLARLAASEAGLL